MKLGALLKNFASMASLRVAMAIFGFALFWYLSHHLSTAQLGGFSLLMNLFFMLQVMPLLGLNMPLVRHIASHPQEAAQEVSNSFYFALPNALLLALGLTAAGASYADVGLFWPFVLLGLSMLPTAWTVVAESQLLGSEHMHSIAYVNLFEIVGRVLGAWAVVSHGGGLIGLFTVFLGLRLLVALIYLVAADVPVPRWRLLKKTILTRYWREFPTFFSIAVVTALCARVDIILLSKVLNLHETGLYAAASRLSDAALMVPTLASIVMFPRLSRLFHSDQAAFVSMLESAVRWSLIAGFALALLALTLAPVVIHLIYSPSLAPCIPIFQMLIYGATLMVVDQLLSATMMAAHAQHDDLRSMGLGLLVLIAMLWACASEFGLRGAGVAAPLAILIRVLYRLNWARQQFASPLLHVTLRVLIAAGAAVGLWLAVQGWSAAYALLAAWLSYALVLRVSGAISGRDMLLIRDAWQRVRQPKPL